MKSLILLIIKLLLVLRSSSLTTNQANQGPHPCNRKCQKGAQPMTCQYHFDVEYYYSMSSACGNCPFNMTACANVNCVTGAGIKRPILTINKQIPGTPIEVCVGDTVTVDVTNSMESDSTTIHWHGITQVGTPYMDGVPYVTQCPVVPHDTFRYTFKVTDAGTHFWHPHIGMQRGDGAVGALIVKQPDQDNLHNGLYDHDLSSHVMVIHDWTVNSALHTFLRNYHAHGDTNPETLLVNGRGRYIKFNGTNGETIYTPTARFVVQKGQRYRMRVINNGFLSCPIVISIDNHPITVISSDGHDVKPVQAATLVTYAGERFDFIVNADQAEGNYWIKFRGLLSCDQKGKSAFQLAVLQYSSMPDNSYPAGNPTYADTHKTGLQINPMNEGKSNNNYLTIANLQALEPKDDVLKEKADVVHFFAYDFEFLQGNPLGWPLTPQINHISLKFAGVPLLPQRDSIDQTLFCNESTAGECRNKFCHCLYVIQEFIILLIKFGITFLLIPLNSVVEMVFIDEGKDFDYNHPIHLHGHTFRIVGLDRLGNRTTVDQVKSLYNNGQIKRNLETAPIKDTVTVPDGGYTIARFKASNPGYWLIHCHLEYHIEFGMGIVFKIGEDSQMPAVPQNFPKCYNYRT